MPTSAPTTAETNRFIWKMYLTLQVYMIVWSPVLAYIIGLITGLSKEQGVQAMTRFNLPTMMFTGFLFPYVLVRYATKRALAEVPGEPQGQRLVRILQVPQIIEIGVIISATVGTLIYSGLCAAAYNKPTWTVLWASFTTCILGALIMVQARTVYERVMRPYALAEFHRNPTVPFKGSGVLWPRQQWSLPYTFGLFVACTLAASVTIFGRQVLDAYSYLKGQVEHASNAQFGQILDDTMLKLASDSAIPICAVGAFLLVNAALAAWQIARQQSEGAKSVQSAMVALATGSPKLPDWVSTDEIGDLSSATARVFEQLKALSLSLGESANSLRRSAEELGLSTSKQSEVLTLQATALQETQVTAQEIKQTSALASQKAEGVLQQTEQADQISHAGEAAIQRSLNGLQEIGEQVQEMARRIKALDDRTRQIANITTTVKDLADQSNMLALNAAIEAVRSGEHGKGFGVVAREIRALADQSIQATNNVREILQDISDAIRSTVSITEKGSEKVEASLAQVREFGTNIRQLSGIVRDNAASVRQITAAVTQQNAGIGQIFQAVNDLSKLMDQTMTQLRASDEAVVLVRTVVEKVSGFVGNYGWVQTGDKAQ